MNNQMKELESNKKRNAIVMFFLVNIILINLMIFDNQIKALEDVHQYNTTVSSMKCTVGEEYSGDTFLRNIDMLEITVLDDVFVASDIPNEICNLLPKEYLEGSDIHIWHDEGYIYQLMSGDKMLLPYEWLKSGVNIHRNNDREPMYFFALIVFWFFSFQVFSRSKKKIK